jgi:hypothetical protein
MCLLPFVKSSIPFVRPFKRCHPDLCLENNRGYELWRTHLRSVCSPGLLLRRVISDMNTQAQECMCTYIHSISDSWTWLYLCKNVGHIVSKYACGTKFLYIDIDFWCVVLCVAGIIVKLYSVYLEHILCVRGGDILFFLLVLFQTQCWSLFANF